MTDHEKLMLRRHLLRAARVYDQIQIDISNDLPEGPCRTTAMGFYKAHADNARDLVDRLARWDPCAGATNIPWRDWGPDAELGIYLGYWATPVARIMPGLLP